MENLYRFNRNLGLIEAIDSFTMRLREGNFGTVIMLRRSGIGELNYNGKKLNNKYCVCMSSTYTDLNYLPSARMFRSRPPSTLPNRKFWGWVLKGSGYTTFFVRQRNSSSPFSSRPLHVISLTSSPPSFVISSSLLQ